MVSSVNIALPTIGRDLSMSAVELSWVTTAYLLCSTVLLIPFGRIADNRGRKAVFSLGMAILTLSAFFSVLARNGLFLIATRMLHGIGAAMIFGTGMAMLTSVYPPEKRGKILGINVSFTYFGLMLGPTIGGFLTHNFGWRSIFGSTLPIGLAALTIALTAIRQEWKEKEEAGFDFLGVILYGGSITLVLIGVSRLTSTWGIISTIFGMVAGMAFFVYESRVAQPILPIGLFKSNRVFAFSNLAALINYGATYAVGFLMSLFLQYVKGMRPDKAGMIMIVQPLIMAIFSPLTGMLSDRIEPRIPASTGMGFITIGLLLLAALNADSSILRIVLTLMLLGSGFALFSSPNTNAVMGSVDRSRLGIASATVGTMRLLGQVFSMGFTMLLVSIMIGKGNITPDRHPQFLSMMHLAGLLFAGLSAVGVAVSLVRGKMREG
jgi:EmrB/QacA subfamily drug resistance transporter